MILVLKGLSNGKRSSCGNGGFGKLFHSKLTWLALRDDHADLCRRVEQLTALLRPVKPWNPVLPDFAAEFVTAMVCVRAAINIFGRRTSTETFPSVVRHSPRERSAIIRLHEDPKRFAKRVNVVLSINIFGRTPWCRTSSWE